MGWRITGASGNDADVDANGNLLVAEGLPALPAAGGFYGVTGTTAAVAASLASNTSMMAMRFAVGSTRKAYVTRVRVLMAQSSAAGAATLVPGAIGIQRFNTAAMSGGVARTAAELNELSTATDMTDIRDSAAALTVTSVVFGTILSQWNVPLFVASGTLAFDHIFEPEYPCVLNPGDGICLRTQVVMPATQQWLFSYSVRWYEK